MLDLWSESDSQFELELETDDFANELLEEDNQHVNQLEPQSLETVP